MRIVLALLLTITTLVPIGGNVVVAQDLDCNDFATIEEARGAYYDDPSDPYDLDGDDNGLPCEMISSGGAIYDVGEDTDPPNGGGSASVAQAGGDLIIYAVDQNGTLVAGACFLVSALTDSPAGSVQLCDNDPAGDVPHAAGVFDTADAAGVTAFPTGSFAVTVSITTVPVGYELAPGTRVAYTPVSYTHL